MTFNNFEIEITIERKFMPMIQRYQNKKRNDKTNLSKLPARKNKFITFKNQVNSKKKKLRLIFTNATK